MMRPGAMRSPMGRGMPPPTGPVAQAKAIGPTLRRLGRLIVADRLRVAVIMLCTVASVALNVLGPWGLGRVTDAIIADMAAAGRIAYGPLARGLGLVGLLYLGAALFNWRQAWLTNTLVQTLSRDLRRAAEEKLGRLPMAWFDRQPHGEVLSRVTNDIDNVSQSLQQMLSQLLMSLLTLIGVLTMMMVLSGFLTLAALTSLTLTLLASRAIAARSQPYFAAQWRLTGQLNGQVEEDFSGHTLVRVYGHAPRARDAFAATNDKLADSALKAQFMSSIIHPVSLFIGNLAFIAICAGGALLVLAGTLSVGALQSFIQYIRQLNQPLSQVASMAAVLQSAAASAERVFELLDAPEMSDEAAAGAAPEPVRGHVVFDRVRFRYAPERPLFESVSLEALPGQTVAIVGPTGAGKTTLVNLLMRFYEIDGGAITLDGVDLRAMRREALRRHVGMVLQDTWLFTGSIRDNISYGRLDASEDEIREAAVACHVDDFVRTLPLGYDTLLDADAGSLSIGQRQLLTIARAFVARPSVLILDEATSSVDTRTELLVQEALGRLRVGRTSFVIAHRLSTIRNADLIAFMDNGTVVELGDHARLMARRGAYWRLQQAQYADA
jgi:ATP-binding cassette subfamily B protein